MAKRSVRLRVKSEIDDGVLLNVFLNDAPIDVRAEDFKNVLSLTIEIRNETGIELPRQELEVVRKDPFQPKTEHVDAVEPYNCRSTSFRLPVAPGHALKSIHKKLPSEIELKYHARTWTVALEIGLFAGRLYRRKNDPSEEYAVGVFGTALAGKSTLINMVYTLLSVNSFCCRMSTVAPVRPAFDTTDDGQVRYDKYCLDDINVPMSLYEASPFTTKTVESDAFTKRLLQGKICGKGGKELDLDAMIVIIKNNDVVEEKSGAKSFLKTLLANVRRPIRVYVREGYGTGLPFNEIKRQLNIADPSAVLEMPVFDVGTPCFEMDRFACDLISWAKERASSHRAARRMR